MKTTLALLLVVAGLFFTSSVQAGNLRIIGGEKVSLEQYPYMAALVARGDSAEQAFCGASVINETWVMTAAHCLTGVSANGLDILTGVSTLSKATTGQRIKASRIIIHPNYNDSTVVNDIALVELAIKTTAPNIRVASTNQPETFSIGSAVSVAGWGNTSTTDTRYPDVLRAVDLKVSDFSSCSNVYGGLESNQMCATVPGGIKDSCNGDSGGPLVAKTSRGAVQVGIVSFGDACASATHPGVYTKVSEYADFLSQANPTVGMPSSSQNESAIAEGPDSPTETSTVAVVDSTEQNGDYGFGPIDWTENCVDTNDVLDSSDAYPGDELMAESELIVSIVENFQPTAIGESSWSVLELYNSEETPILLSNLQLPEHVSLGDFSEPCLESNIDSNTACYLELEWTPVSDVALNTELTLDVFDGSTTNTEIVALVGDVLAPLNIGEEIDWPQAEYFASEPDEWGFDSTESTVGGTSISSQMQSTDSMSLVGAFNSEKDHELEFSYQLTGVACHIFIDNERVYELAQDDQWQSASFLVPAGAEVRWEFSATKRDKNQRQLRLDGLNLGEVKNLALGLIPPNTATAAQLNSVNETIGGGSFGGIAAFFVSVLIVFRRVGSSRKHSAASVA